MIKSRNGMELRLQLSLHPALHGDLIKLTFSGVGDEKLELQLLLL